MKYISLNNIISYCLHTTSILENIHAKYLEGIKHTIEALKNNGLKIAIDYFGIEYGNLNMLEIVEFDIIKQDKYFIIIYIFKDTFTRSPYLLKN
ncbi:EAL domain-containing protein [Terrisporobacter petrolearius]|uniref:EAL domain-containing protein n=1 Tax=Terrisporobacter petrolearius TaxID=1460447 RepID=UPI001D161725|nr:EAL domain-containing protein [Terrisporobacter petrolearius]MCC3865575.1 EAL domain-containing protein [Terrisporobacter petrolearius]